MKININEIAWEKNKGLIPVIIQHAITSEVLMLCFMNQEALQQTLATHRVTFYSRSKNRLWMKGETSGNVLELINIFLDCDKDTLLIIAKPSGPVCHTGDLTCFGEKNKTDWGFIQELEKMIADRGSSTKEDSYTYQLLHAGISRIAQKIGEEGVEVALAAIEKNDEECCAEIADLFFHILVLLYARKLNISDVIDILKARREKK